MDEVFFKYRHKGQDCGFLTEKGRFITIKTATSKDTSTFTSFPLDGLKTKLRTLVKTKSARIVKLGDSEAVAVPANLTDCLFLDQNDHK